MACALLHGASALGQIYANSVDKIPAGWSGPSFKLSRDYPHTLPAAGAQPWRQFNPTTQPEQYMRAVLAYFLEGNEAANWVVQDNRVRKWYHAPSMAWQTPTRPYGREFIHGLTRERNSLPKELAATQTATAQNWAVGFYNPAGGYTFGQVWADTLALQINKALFPEGTVTAKLLFTAAPLTQVPYLQGSLLWQANIATAVTQPTRVPQPVRLLQLDIAVKDARASETGWVFGTFAYHTGAGGKTVWENMVPVGLMWGNDPGKFQGQALTQTWINPRFEQLFRFPDGTPMHVGYQGRLDGPVDNPKSSCLSCHSTAQTPQVASGMVPKNDSLQYVTPYFRNVKSGTTFDGLPGSHSLDYSLQMSGGIGVAVSNGHARVATPAPAFAKRGGETEEAMLLSAEQQALEVFFTSMDYEHPAHADSVASKPAKRIESEQATSTSYLWWIVGGVALALVALILYRSRRA